jgi:hypothetical protein
MKFNNWLQEIKSCPDDVGVSYGKHRITLEYGIYDNFPILVKADIEKVVEDLEKINNFKQYEQMVDGDSITHRFIYIPGTANFQVFGGLCPHPSFPKNATELIHNLQQTQNYNMTIMLHDMQPCLCHNMPGKKMSGVSNFRAMAICIEGLTDYIKENNFPFCIPCSRGANHSSDLSRIVYWPDFDDNKIIESVRQVNEVKK